MLSPVFATIRLLLLTIWILCWIGLIAIAYFLKRWKLRDKGISYVCRGALAICGVRLKINGALSTARPLMLVSNHISYLDVPIIGSVVNCRFTPKREIETWPIQGFFCKIVGSIFVDRSPKKIQSSTLAIQDALAKGEVVSVFPEATTGDGRHLVPFKPAFFEIAASGSNITIQPLAIVYRKIRNLPINLSDWPSIAWYGDMTLLPHIWKLLSLGRIDVEVSFLPTISVQAGFSRKLLAQLAETQIAEEIEARRNS